jgi:hypothetical protein
MAAAAANEDDDDDDDPPERNAMMSMIALGFDNVDAPLSSSAAAAEEDPDTYAATTMRASMMEGRRLAILRRSRDRMRRFNMSDVVISHHQVQEFNAFADFDAQMQNAMLSSSSAAAASSYDTSNYFVDEPDPEPEPEDSD